MLGEASGRCWVLLGELAGVYFDMLIGTQPFVGVSETQRKTAALINRYKRKYLDDMSI